MSFEIVDVSREVRQKALAQGAGGARWLKQLGEMIDGVERDWQVSVGRALAGGSDSYVAEATTHDGRQAVLKLALPGSEASHEIETLVRADGRGYVRLLHYDGERQAMLQERLGPSLADLGLSVEKQVEVICGALLCAWEVSPDARFPSGSDKARALATFIVRTWEELGRPCSDAVIDRSLSFAGARRQAFGPECAVLVHGDAHSANTLARLGRAGSVGGCFTFVDPDGLFAERACDLAVPMRDWSQELLAGDTLRCARRRCAQLSRLCGVAAQPIWEWGFMERVSTALLALQVGREELGRDMLAVAETMSSIRRI
ncbi:MAG: streptomycin 6-kinase [Thermoleophilaceae bacterium]|nr:streptomycin 6-kinase [Thermoleophilaceae bacterium]